MDSSGGSQQDSNLYFSAELQDNVSPTADQIEERLKKLGASRHEIKIFMQAYDQASQKIQQAQEHLKKLPKNHMINIQANTSQIDQAHKRLEGLRAAAKAPITLVMKVGDNIDEHFRSFKAKIPQMETELKGALRNMPLTAGLLNATSSAYGLVSGPVSTMTGLPFSSLGAGGAALGVGGASAAFFAKSFQQNANLEQQMAQLNQIMRSPAAAQTSYNQVVQTATTTPFNMPDVLKAYIQMAQMGTNPKNPAFGIKSATNLAAGAQVPVSQATGALQAASLGYFEQFNTLTGRNIRQTDFTYGGRYSGQTYESATLGVLKQYQNASEVQMHTFKGLMTNIQDVITQKLVIPAGAPLFGAAKGLEQQTAGKLQSPAFQLQMGREVDKLQESLVKVFQLVEQGSTYFKNSLEQPLKQITSAAVSLGSVFAKTFGGAVITGVKYLGEALTTILTPLASVAKQMPIIGQAAGLFKALHMFGISTNTGIGDIAKGLGTLNPFRLIQGFKELSSVIAKIGFYEVVKSFLDMKNANDQLDASFKGFGHSGKEAVDQLKVGFDGLIFRANELGKSVAQLKTYGAIYGEAIGPNVGMKRLAQSERFGALDIAKLSMNLGMGGQDTAQVMATWAKAMHATGAIQGGVSPRREADTIYTQIYQAAEKLSTTLGISLNDAAKDATVSLSLFKTQLGQAHMIDPRGASAAYSIYGMLQRPGGMTGADQSKFGSPAQLVQQLLSNATAPGIGVLQHALAQPGGLRSSFDFYSNYPMLRRSAMSHTEGSVNPFTEVAGATKDLQSTLRAYENVPRSSAQFNQQIQNQFGWAANLGGQGHLQLPQFQNVLPQLGVHLNSQQIPNMTTKETAQSMVQVNTALNNQVNVLQKVNAQVTRYQEQLSALQLVGEQASAAMAKFNLSVEAQQNAIDRWQLSLSQAQLGLNAVERAVAAVGQQMADYEHNKVLPVQRAQEDWNQTMLLTSNRLEDVSFKMQVAQFNMDKFNSGMLTGENTLTAQIEKLTVYNSKLDELRLLNMGMQADITKTNFHQGFTSTVKPLVGFDLSREIQLGQERQQMMQDQYNTTYGYQHWKLQRAARPLFQRQEMSYADRLAGTTQARGTLDKGTLETMAIQIQQYHEQLHSRELEKKMYALTVGQRGLQDKQYKLQREAFFMQQSISKESDRIAKAQLAIQEKQLPLQHALNHIQNKTQLATYSIDRHLIPLTEKQGALQTAVSDLHAVFGELSGQFDKNIKVGDDSVLGHLRNIAKNMGVSVDVLHSINHALGGHAFGTRGQPHPSSGPGGIKGFFNAIPGPLDLLQSLQDITHNAAGSIGLPGPLATALGVGAFGAAGLAGLNVAHIMGTHTTGALGQGLANRANRLLGAEGKSFSHPLLSLESKGGEFFSGLRQGDPWEAMAHPSFALRSIMMERVPALSAFGLVTGITGNPLLGAGAAALAGQIGGREGGRRQFTTDAEGKLHYRQGVLTSALFHPRRTIRSMFGAAQTATTEGAGTVTNLKNAAVAADRETGMSATLREMAKTAATKFTTTAPGIVGVMKSARVPGLGISLGGDEVTAVESAASKGQMNLFGTATGRAPVAGEQLRLGGISPLTAEEQASTANKIKAAADESSVSGKTFKTTVSNWWTDTKTALTRARDNTDRFGKSVANNLRGSRTLDEAARTGERNAGVVKDASKIEHEAAKISHSGSSILSRGASLFTKEGMTKFFSHVTKFGGAVGLFELLPKPFRNAIEHFASTIGGAFVTAIKNFGSIIADTFRGIVDDFKGIVSDLGKFIRTLPGVKSIAPAARDASLAAKAAEDAGRLTNTERGGLVKTLTDHAKSIAGHAGKWIELGGKLIQVAGIGIQTGQVAIEILRGQYKSAAQNTFKDLLYANPVSGTVEALASLGILPASNRGSPGSPVPFTSITPGGLIAPPLFGGGGNGPRSPGVNPVTKLPGGATYSQGGLNLPGDPIPLFVENQKKALQIAKQYQDLTFRQKQEFINLSGKQQSAAQDAALNGPNGLKNYLGQINDTSNHAYSRLSSNQANYHNTRLKTAASGYNKENQTTGAGFQAIASTSSGWYDQLTRQIQKWEKANGLPISTKHDVSSSSGMSTAALSAIATQTVGGGSLTFVGGSFAHGGLVHADKHKVGPGRMVRMVEEGHPEVVIPLAPHRRDRAKSLINQTRGMLGMAAGGYMFPFSGSGWGQSRTDQGVDFYGSASVGAIGPGKVTYANPNDGWYAPYPAFMVYQLTGGPDRGKYIYAAEGIKNLAPAGTTVKAGQALAQMYAPIEMGWAAGPLGHQIIQPMGANHLTQAGQDFAAFIQGLQHGVITGGAFGVGGGGSGRTVPPIHLKDVPNALKQFGVAGPDQFKILEHVKKKAQAALNQRASSASVGSAGSGIYKFGATPSGGYTPTTFAEALLKGMHLGGGHQAVLDLLKWEQAEGGNWNNTARYNPLNTTLAMPGSTNPGFSAGVQAYTSWQQGLEATAKTLSGSSYAGIRAALNSGAPLSAFASAVYASPWGTTSGLSGGLPRVPHDNYPAMLHKDEQVLTAGEAEYRRKAHSPHTRDLKLGLDAFKAGIEKSWKEIMHLRDDIKHHAAASVIHKDLQELHLTLKDMKKDGHQLLLNQINAEIKATGPKAARLDHLLGREVAKGRGGPFGSAGSQFGAEMNNLIRSLHNIYNPKTKSYHSLEDEILKLRTYKQTAGTDNAELKKINKELKTATGHHKAQLETQKKHLEHVIKRDNKNIHHEQKSIHSDEMNFIKQGMAKGISRQMLTSAIRNVGIYDNAQITSDIQLHHIHSAIGQYHAPSTQKLNKASGHGGGTHPHHHHKSYATGGPVRHDALAMVHAGEHVVPREGALVIRQAQHPGTAAHYDPYTKKTAEHVQKTNELLRATNDIWNKFLVMSENAAVKGTPHYNRLGTLQGGLSHYHVGVGRGSGLFTPPASGTTTAAQTKQFNTIAKEINKEIDKMIKEYKSESKRLEAWHKKVEAEWKHRKEHLDKVFHERLKQAERHHKAMEKEFKERKKHLEKLFKDHQKYLESHYKGHSKELKEHMKELEKWHKEHMKTLTTWHKNSEKHWENQKKDIEKWHNEHMKKLDDWHKKTEKEYDQKRKELDHWHNQVEKLHKEEENVNEKYHDAVKNHHGKQAAHYLKVEEHLKKMADKIERLNPNVMNNINVNVSGTTATVRTTTSPTVNR